MKGICNYKDKTCKYDHPEVCPYWRKGNCKKTADQCSKLHQERPIQKARKMSSTHTNHVNQQSPEKKQKKARSPSAKSSSSKSSKSSGDKGKKDKKKSPKKTKKKDNGHAAKQSHPQ